jgi:hypothetical protein
MGKESFESGTQEIRKRTLECIQKGEGRESLLFGFLS